MNLIGICIPTFLILDITVLPVECHCVSPYPFSPNKKTNGNLFCMPTVVNRGPVDILYANSF